MDAVIKESLRLYPPVLFIGRVLGEDAVIGQIITHVKHGIINNSNLYRHEKWNFHSFIIVEFHSIGSCFAS